MIMSIHRLYFQIFRPGADAAWLENSHHWTKERQGVFSTKKLRCLKCQQSWLTTLDSERPPDQHLLVDQNVEKAGSSPTLWNKAIPVDVRRVRHHKVATNTSQPSAQNVNMLNNFRSKKNALDVHQDLSSGSLFRHQSFFNSCKWPPHWLWCQNCIVLFCLLLRLKHGNPQHDNGWRNLNHWDISI